MALVPAAGCEGAAAGVPNVNAMFASFHDLNAVRVLAAGQREGRRTKTCEGRDNSLSVRRVGGVSDWCRELKISMAVW